PGGHEQDAQRRIAAEVLTGLDVACRQREPPVSGADHRARAVREERDEYQAGHRLAAFREMARAELPGNTRKRGTVGTYDVCAAKASATHDIEKPRTSRGLFHLTAPGGTCKWTQ